jgi:RNA polymerase sigma factor (sigma-70 family)
VSAEIQKKRIGEFLAAEWTRLVRFVRARIADSAEADAEDIVQEVMEGIFERADVTAPIVDVAGYVYRSLANRIIDSLRARRPEAPLADVLPDVRYEAAGQMERETARERLFAAIDGLPPAQKAVLVATEMEGASYRELAEEWDEPIGTLLARKHRALRTLRKTLGKTLEGGKE